MDLSAPHRVPLTWLMAHGSEAIQLRTARELAPEGREDLPALELALVESKAIQALTRKQKDNGVWGGNLLGVNKSAKDGIKDVGTIQQYRRLIQLGYPSTGRPFKLADRLLWRYLSRDDDPALLFEYRKTVKAAPAANEWVRNHLREAATCALAEAGHDDDPRIRGAAHRIATSVSQFLRSPLAEKPFSRSGKALILNPAAHPPSWYSISMVASTPNLRRERAGFSGRLANYLLQPASRRTYVIPVGRKKIKPIHVVLGDPMEADARGNVRDLPLALQFIEVLCHLGVVGESTSAVHVLERLYRSCDDQGVWRPKRVPAVSKLPNPVTYHSFPLQTSATTGEGRFADVTFRLARIAKLMDRPIEYT